MPGARHPALRIEPVTPDRWDDLERLFGPRGACAGCWCQWWKLKRSDFEAGKGEGNRAALEQSVRAGQVPGLLAYADDAPVGWCSIEPREAFPKLLRSRNLAPVDDAPAWAVPCFFVARSHRRQGVTRALLKAAIDHARAHGATLVEGYPVDYDKPVADAFAYTGVASIFEEAGFEEVARRSATRPIMRRPLRRR